MLPLSTRLRTRLRLQGVSVTTAAFQYVRPLRKDAHEIRLLNIAPADALASPLQCDLTCVSLDDNPSYHALSYTWGKPFGERHSEGPFTPTYTEKILDVQNQRFHITDNLNSALRYLRPKDETPSLWVDAICIN